MILRDFPQSEVSEYVFSETFKIAYYGRCISFQGRGCVQPDAPSNLSCLAFLPQTFLQSLWFCRGLWGQLPSSAGPKPGVNTSPVVVVTCFFLHREGLFWIFQLQSNNPAYVLFRSLQELFSIELEISISNSMGEKLPKFFYILSLEFGKESKYLIHFSFPAWSFPLALRIGILVLWRESNIVQLYGFSCEIPK